MPFWAQTLLILAAVALMLALVAAVAAALALPRGAPRARSGPALVAQEPPAPPGQAPPPAQGSARRRGGPLAGAQDRRGDAPAPHPAERRGREEGAGARGRGAGARRRVARQEPRALRGADAAPPERLRGRQGRDARGNPQGIDAAACLSSSCRTPRSLGSGARSISAVASPSRRRSTPWSWRSPRSGATTR